jgi:hypothetical protein
VRVALVGAACRAGRGLQHHGICGARPPARVGDLQWERHGTRVRRWDAEGVVADAHLRPVARAAAPRWQQQAGGAARDEHSARRRAGGD